MGIIPKIWGVQPRIWRSEKGTQGHSQDLGSLPGSKVAPGIWGIQPKIQGKGEGGWGSLPGFGGLSQDPGSLPGSLTSSCSSSLSSSLRRGLGRPPRAPRRRPFPRSGTFSFRPRRIFTFTERAGGNPDPPNYPDSSISSIPSPPIPPSPLPTPTLRLGSFLLSLLLLLALLSVAFLLLFHLLPDTGEHRLEHNGILVDLEENRAFQVTPGPLRPSGLLFPAVPGAVPGHARGSFLVFRTRDPSRLKVWAFWHSSITSFSRSLRLRYLWFRIRSWEREKA